MVSNSEVRGVCSATINSSWGRRSAGGTAKPSFFGLGVRREGDCFGFVSGINSSLYGRNFLPRHLEFVEHLFRESPPLVGRAVRLGVHHGGKLLRGRFRYL